MNEHDARQVLLVRTLESAPRAPHWTDEDRDWASREAARIEGEHAHTSSFIARRAASAIERLKTRAPLIDRLLQALTWRSWLVPAFMLGAFLLALLLDAVAADRRINILAPPLLALLLWNLLVYLAMAASAIRTRWRSKPRGNDDRSQPGATKDPARGAASDSAGRAGKPGPIARAFARVAGLAGTRLPKAIAGSLDASPNSSLNSPLNAALSAFVSQWATLSAPLSAARSGAGLHLSAAAFAAGALAGLYFRGLAFEYLAGWESTFLSATGVERLLGVVLGPASLLSGIALPDAAHLESLRFAAGAGENAGRWIHLHAVTIALAVIVPRLVLGALATLRARRMAADFPLPLTDTYYQGLDRHRSGARASIDVLPYSLSLREASVMGLKTRLRELFGADAEVRLAATIALGQEDELARRWTPGESASLVVALYSMSATPESETHGQFLRQLTALVAQRAPIAVLIDESAMRQRFGGDATRLASRRTAWRRMCTDIGGIEPAFVWLEGTAAEEGEAARSSLRKVIDEISVRMGQNAGLKLSSTGPAN